MSVTVTEEMGNGMRERVGDVGQHVAWCREVAVSPAVVVVTSVVVMPVVVAVKVRIEMVMMTGVDRDAIEPPGIAIRISIWVRIVYGRVNGPRGRSGTSVARESEEIAEQTVGDAGPCEVDHVIRAEREPVHAREIVIDDRVAHSRRMHVDDGSGGLAHPVVRTGRNGGDEEDKCCHERSFQWVLPFRSNSAGMRLARSER